MKNIRIFVLLLLISCIGIVSAREILLGTSAVFSGPSSKLGENYNDGAMLYINSVNNSGGINGAMINVITYDDSYTPIPCIENTLRLIDSNEVDLLFNYVGTPTTTSILPLLKINEHKNMLLFGNLTGAGGQRKVPYKQYVFNIRASYMQETAELVSYFRDSGKEKIGVFYQIDGYGRSGFDGVREELSKDSLRITAEATYIRGAKWEESMAVQAQHFLNEEVEAIVSVGSYEACAAFIRDARRIGLSVPIANISFVGTEELLKILETNSIPTDSLVFSEVVPDYNSSQFPIAEEYINMLQGSDLTPNFISFEGYINAKILLTIFEDCNIDISRSNMKLIFEQMEPIDIGIGEQLHFTEDQHQILQKVYLYTYFANKLIEVSHE